MNRLKKLLGVIGFGTVFFSAGVTFADEPIMTLKGHEDFVESVAFSLNGKAFVSGSRDNTIKLWDVKNGKLLQTFQTSNIVNCVTFNTNGNMLATSNRHDTIKLWDIKTGKLLQKLKSRYDASCVAFSPKKDNIVSAHYKLVKYIGLLNVWDAKTGKLLQTFSSKGGVITAISYSPNGKAILFAQDNTIKIINTNNGELLNILKDHKGAYITSLAFSPKGDVIASGNRGSNFNIKLWSIKNRKLLKTISTGDSAIYSLVFDSMGKVIMTKHYDIIKIWDIEKEIVLGEIKNKKYLSSNLSYAGNILLSGDRDGNLKLWDMNPYNEILANLVYKSIDKSDYIALYEFTKKFSDKFNVTQEAFRAVNSAASSENNIEAMYHMKGASYAPLALAITERIIELEKNKRTNIYKTIVEKNAISGYQWFMRTYPKSEDFGNATKAMYGLIEKENTIASYRWFSDIFLINTSKESAKALEEITKLMFTKAKEIDDVSSYAAFVQRYPLTKGAVEATEKIYSILFAKTKEKNTVKAYNEFIYACPLAAQVKEANKKAYEIEKTKYTDIGMLGFIGKDGKMNKQTRKLLIEAKKILDTAISKEEFLTFRNLGYFIVVGRMYELVRSEFGETDAALKLQESENIDKFKKRYQDFIYSLGMETSDWESKAQMNESIVNLVNEVVGDVYTDKQLIDFYNNSGKEAFAKYLNDDKKETEKFLQKREQDEREQIEKRTNEIREKTANFKKLYQKIVEEYKPEN